MKKLLCMHFFSLAAGCVTFQNTIYTVREDSNLKVTLRLSLVASFDVRVLINTVSVNATG